jgi:uncharacterized protein involved in response to NO
MKISSILQNPYRPLFLIGTISAIIGAGLWMPYGFQLMNFYPGRMHAHLMMGVFLLSFASGFLMTAIPKMTGTFPSGKVELFLQITGLIFTAGCGLINKETTLFFISILLNLTMLLFFVGKRFLVKKNNPPDVFPFVMAGILSGLLGSIFWIFGLYTIGHRLFYLNFILCLVLGVGSKLIPMLLRLGPAKPNSKRTTVFLAIILFISNFFEDYYLWSLGPWIRSMVVLWVGIFYWRVFEKSTFNSGFTNGIRLSAISVILGSLLLALDPIHRMEWLHLIYISGFALLTFLVATRVILAHGGHDLNLEVKNWRITATVVLILLAAATRALAPFWPAGYNRHLAYSAFCLVFALVIWGWFFIPKLKGKTPFSSDRC